MVRKWYHFMIDGSDVRSCNFKPKNVFTLTFLLVLHTTRKNSTFVWLISSYLMCQIWVRCISDSDKALFNNLFCFLLITVRIDRFMDHFYQPLLEVYIFFLSLLLFHILSFEIGLKNLFASLLLKLTHIVCHNDLREYLFITSDSRSNNCECLL